MYSFIHHGLPSTHLDMLEALWPGWLMGPYLLGAQESCKDDKLCPHVTNETAMTDPGLRVHVNGIRPK